MRKYLKYLLFIAFASSANAMDLDVNKGEIIRLPRPASHIFIADPEVADIDVRSPNYVYVYGVSVGETTLHALDSDQNEILKMNINVRHNTHGLSSLIKEALPDSKVTFSSIGDGLVIKGVVDTPEDAEMVMRLASSATGDSGHIINMLKINGSDQVMLKVKVAEVARSNLKNFGINLSSILTKGSFAFGVFTGRDFLNSSGDLIREGNNIQVSGSPGRVNASGVLDALENEGFVKTLAEPNLTAKSGETASFLAGGEYPIPVPQDNGVTTIEYKEFGVRLSFTPIVLSPNRIGLQVAPEVSSLTSSAVTINNSEIPTLSTRKASTTVELGSGESFAIAGLMQNDVTNSISKFPWLGDLPVLGALFRSNDYQKNETELVIIVTPYIVKGVKESDKLLSPTDGYEVPNDFERLLMGKLYVEKPAGIGKGSDKIARYKLNGDAGFALGE
jgi:pilus assembly protein CpaC